jgi:hypothetical protein
MVTGQLKASAALFPGNELPAFTENEGGCSPQLIRTLEKTRIFSFSFRELNPDSLAVQSAAVTIMTELSHPVTKMRFAPTTFHADTRNQMQVNNNVKIKYSERYGQTRFSRYANVVCTDTKHNKI